MFSRTLEIDWTQGFSGAISLAQGNTLFLILVAFSLLNVVLGIPLLLLTVIKRWLQRNETMPAWSQPGQVPARRKRRKSNRPKGLVLRERLPRLPKHNVPRDAPRKDSWIGSILAAFFRAIARFWGRG